MGGQPFSYVSQLLKLSKRVNLESSGPVYSFNDHRGGGGYDGQVTVNDLVFESWQAWSCHEEAKESVAQLAVTFLKGLEHQLSKNPAYSGNPSDPFPDVPGVTDKKRTFDDRQQHDIHQDSLKSAASDEDDVRIPKRPFMQRLNDYAQAKRLTLEWEYNRVKNLYHCSVTFQGTRYKSRKRHQRQLDAKEDCAELICKYLDASKDQTHSSFASNSVLVKHPMAALNEYCQIHHFSFETTYPTANQQGAVCSIQVLQKDMTVVEFTSEFYNSKALAKSFAAEGTLKRLKDLASATAESQQPNQLTGVSSMDSCLDPKDILSFDVPMDISQ